MAVQAPLATDTTEIQFILASKNRIFTEEIVIPDQKCNLLATASTHGIVIIGCNIPELRISLLKNLTSQIETENDKSIPLRTVPLPSPAFQISINCDQSLLAVDVNINGIPHIQIYSVASFLLNNVQKLTEFRLSQTNSRSSHILWNPVISNMVCICAEDGAMAVYSLKQQGFEFHSLEGANKAQCACWSPKGKQIVVGFANGKLVQYKPDLKPARVIDCPPNIVEGGVFDIIALQWLSTYQFAAVFLSKAQDSTPALHIVNAPKAGPPTYINYDDVCYSQSGPRKGQVFLIHIIQWNLLLVASANSIEVGLLGTKESGEAPMWIQWSTTDDARAELPLDSNKKETYPVGFVLETGVTDGITICDIKQKVMPMIHILATNGILVSFNLMNFAPNYVDICSPPRPIDNSVLNYFQPLLISKKVDQMKTPPNANPAVDMSFAFGATSTPAAATKPKPLFGQDIQQTQPPTGLFANLAKPTGFGVPMTTAQPQPQGITFGVAQAVAVTQPSFANLVKAEPPKPAGLSFGQTPAPPAFGVATAAIPENKPKPVVVTQPEKPKALINVNPTFTPVPQSQKSEAEKAAVPEKSEKQINVDSDENKRIFSRMIKDELLTFEKELKEILAGSKNRIKVDVGSEEESAKIIRTTDELMELKKEATETIDSLKYEIQTLRLELNEMFAMQYEAKSKCEIYRNEKTQFLQDNQITDKTSRRQLERLKKLLMQNEIQLQTITQLIDSQWSSYLETTNKNKKNKMRVPSLEGLYQTLSKQQEIIYSQREKISTIRNKLGIRDEVKKQKSLNKTVESLTDSLISLSMADQVKAETEKLTKPKVLAIRAALKNRPTIVIKPNRPERSDIKSTVILEKRYQAMKQKVKDESKQRATVQKTKPVQQKTTIQEKPKEVQKVVQTHPQMPQMFQQKHQLQQQQQQQQSIASFLPKPNIADTPVAVSASFSISIPKKPISDAPKISQQQPVMKPIQKEEKPTKNENVTITFKLPDKKETAAAPVGLTKPLSASTTDGNPVELPKPSFSFGSAFGGGDSKISFGSPSAPLFGGTNTSSSLSFGAATTTGISTLSFGGVTKSSPFAALNPTTTSQSPVLSITPVDTTKKPEASVTPTPLFNLSTAATVSTTSVTSTNPVSSAQGLNLTAPSTKPQENVMPNIVNVEPKPSIPVNPTTTSKFTFANLAPVTTASEFDQKSLDLSQSTMAKPKTLLFGTTTISAAPSNISTATAPSTAASSFSFGSLSFGTTSAPATTASPILLTPSAVVSSTTSPTANTTETSLPMTPSVFTTPATTPTVSPFGGFLPTKTEESKVSTPSVVSTIPATVSSSVATITTQSMMNTTTTSTTTTLPTATPVDGVTPEQVFGGFNICEPSTKPPTTAASTNIFGSGISFGAVKPEGASLFGSSGASGQPLFGSVATTTATTAQSFGSSIFPAPTTTSAPSLFGSIAKPDQSVFSSAATSTQPVAQSPPFGFGGSAASGGNIFGAATGGTTASPFGQSQPQPQSTFGFGAVAAPTPATTASTFGGFGSPSQATSGGSIFGGANTFGSAAPSGGNIFGGGSASTFGSSTGGGNIFGGGGATQPAANTGSIFGGSNTFGSQAASPGGFGSSLTGGFAKPVFGGTATFGSTATFGGVPSFGSPGKSTGFGLFAQQAPTQQASPTQGNPLFEQLGSASNSGMTFGNLAQTSPVQNQGSGFSGSSFSSWR